ncbi:type 1 glutamine amidotransferase family protein [Nonomuraea sp. NPDC050556]|uniref:type 1 glutamine amidotransferase family protein n=1 Tax=Nonomuraea sp. NPDC050556 TaxID=3364369 RepID=UPI003798ACC7
MNKIHVGVYETLADWETGYATVGLRQNGYEIVTVGLDASPVTTMGGIRIVPDITIDELSPEESSMLVLAGSETWDSGKLDAFGAKAAEFLSAGTPVAAICGATAGMARQGLLDDREHTSAVVYYLMGQEAYKGAEHYVDADAVTGGDLITAGPTAPIEFAREIFTKLDVFTPAKRDAWYRLYKHSDPAAFEELNAE